MPIIDGRARGGRLAGRRAARGTRRRAGDLREEGQGARGGRPRRPPGPGGELPPGMRRRSGARRDSFMDVSYCS